MSELATMGIQVASDAEDDGEIEGVTISPDAYSWARCCATGTSTG